MSFLSGRRIVLCGNSATQTNSLKNKIREFGGQVEYIVNDKTSYVVITDREYTQGGSKVEKAKKKKIPLVLPSFLEACFESGSEVDFKPYQLANVEDYKEVDEEPNSGPVKRQIDDEHTESRKKRKTDLSEEKVNPENLPNENRVETNLKNPNQPAKPKRKKLIPTTGKWRTARIFISSTFRDMHGERDYLTRYVFPELQERCQKLQVHVHPVDLRWGVTSEDTENALELCLTELDNCRPFFIGLLGNRYGWTPNKYNVPNEPKFDWIKITPPGRSITHLEMEYGVLRNPSAARAAFYFRNGDFLETVPPDYRSDFTSETQSSAVFLQELKDSIRDKVSHQNIFEDYPCQWRGVVDGKPMVGGLEAFGKHVLETFWRHFQEEFPITKIETDPLAIERGYHERFIESHSRLFIGRKSLLNQIRDFTNSTVAYPLVITGQPGSGKTSLVSYFAHELTKEMKDSSTTFVITHFIGAAPGSTSIRPTIARISAEIAAHYDFPDKIPEDFKELQNVFHEILKRVGTLETKLILIIDALNQLDNTNRSHALEWLPEEIPPNVRLIVSTLEGDVHEVLQRRQKTEITVGPLTTDEQKEIIRQTLSQYSKKLDQNQTTLLLGKPDANKPLYLIVACEELRVFGVYEQVTEKIKKMAGTVPLLFEEVLQRLEKDHDRDLLIKTLTLLTCSRGGLLEQEMLKLLGSRASNDPLPQNTWASLYRSLVTYLRPPGESGEGVLDFFHQQFPKAVKRLYLKDEPFEIKIHGELADYFWESADPNKNGTWDTGNKRGFSYVVYHQIKAHQWNNLRLSLCNLAFIEGKCEMGMTYDLVNDFLLLADYKKHVPQNIAAEFSEYQRFVMSGSHVLSHNPSLTFSMAYSLPDDSLPFKQAHYRYYQSRSETRPFLKWLNKSQTSNPCIMTLSGHDMVVRCCAISPETRESSTKPKIVAGSDDHTLKIYDATTGEELCTLKGHSNSVMACTFNNKGTQVISAGYDKTIKVWNIDTGLLIRELKGHKGVITCVAAHPRNSNIASGSRDKTIKIWLDNDLVKSIDAAHDKEILSCSYSPDGRYLATASADNTVKIWDTSSWVAIKTCTHHKKPVNCVQWSCDGTELVSASDDRTVVVFGTSGDIIATLKGHKDGATWATFNKTGSRILSASHDNIITLWDKSSGDDLSMLIGHTGSVFSVHYMNENHAISCSFDRSVKVWEVREKVENVGHEARILSVSFSPDGKFVATGSRDKTLKIWDTLKGTELHHLKGHTSNVFGVCWSPDGKSVCSGSRDKSIKIWSASSGLCTHTLLEHKNIVRCVAWSPDGKHILSTSDDKTAIVWDATNDFTKIGVLYGHRAEVIYGAYSSDCRRAATCSDDCTIKLWDTKKNSLSYGTNYVKVATLIYHTQGIKAVDFSPDCKTLISGSEDHKIVQWNARNAKVMSVLEGHTEDIRGVRYSSDGRYIVSGSTDSTLKLWNAKSKQVECAFACLGRLCAIDATNIAFQRIFACGDGSGALYIITPEGLQENDAEKDKIDNI